MQLCVMQIGDGDALGSGEPELSADGRFVLLSPVHLPDDPTATLALFHGNESQA